MEIDAHGSMKIVHGIAPAAHAATTNGAAVDTVGYQSLEWVGHVGVAFAGGGFDITIEQSPDDGSGSPTGVWTAVSAEETLGALPVVAIADANMVVRVGSAGKERHQRAVLTETGTISAGVIGVTAVLGNPEVMPEADQST